MMIDIFNGLKASLLKVHQVSAWQALVVPFLNLLFCHHPLGSKNAKYFKSCNFNKVKSCKGLKSMVERGNLIGGKE